jgi:UDP-glucose 4-epimerase
MNTLILGGAGFIGTNLAGKISSFMSKEDQLTVSDTSISYFDSLHKTSFGNKLTYKESSFCVDTDFDSLLKNQDVVFHLASTIIPASSNRDIPKELKDNIVSTSYLLEAAVRCHVKKVVFISSGGAVYGKENNCPLPESTPTNPLSSYGIEKITIEKLLYLYNYLYGLDYRVIRLSNPYGPYQRPGKLGVISTFIYNALTHQPINLYGDGSVVRDFIYIDDAIRAILTITNNTNKHHTFNVGSGVGTSIKQALQEIECTLNVPILINYLQSRKADVPVNFLDISRYEKYYGKLNSVTLKEGILRTAAFQREEFKLI